MIFKSCDYGTNIAQPQADTHTENLHSNFCIKNSSHFSNFFNFAERKHPSHLNLIFGRKFIGLHVKHFAFGMFCLNVSVKVDLKEPFQLQVVLLSSAEVALSCFSSSIISLFLATRGSSLSLVKNAFSLNNIQLLDPQNWLLVCLGLFADTQLGGWVATVVFVIRINFIG